MKVLFSGYFMFNSIKVTILMITFLYFHIRISFTAVYFVTMSFNFDITHASFCSAFVIISYVMLYHFVVSVLQNVLSVHKDYTNADIAWCICSIVMNYMPIMPHMFNIHYVHSLQRWNLWFRGWFEVLIQMITRWACQIMFFYN